MKTMTSGQRAGRVRSRWIASVALPSLAVLLAAALASGTLQATWNEFQGQEDNRQHEHDAYAIGLWGDVPYSDLQATVGVPNLIADMNRHALAFSVHDGDLKTGNGAPICDDALYTRSLGYFNALRSPAMFTPGDNDWTDCDRPNNGEVQLAGTSDARTAGLLQHGRSRSDSAGSARKCRPTPLCLGVTDAVSLDQGGGSLRREPSLDRWRRDLRDAEYPGLVQQLVRRRAGPAGVRGPEPGRHRVDGGDLRGGRGASLGRGHVHLAGRSRVQPERIRRPAARSDYPRPDGRQSRRLPGVPARAARADVAFGKPVAYVHGDSHYFRIDKPLLDSLAAACRTSRASRPSATTRKRTTTTCSG